MRITSIKIRNFRGLRDVEIPLARTTVLIGENNSGKSSVLDCLSLSLGRRWGQRGTGFSEYDLTIERDAERNGNVETDEAGSGESPTTHGERGATSPAGSSGVSGASIELLFSEQTKDEWPEAITTGLFGIVQTDPVTELNSITLRVTYKLNPLERTYEPGWTFVDVNGDPIGSSEAKRAANTQGFFRFVPVFFLSALRDASEEFSSRSQFWGRLLKAVEISPDEREVLDEAIEELNARLLAADPRVTETVDRLKEIQQVVASGAAADVSIRALPMKVWELLAHSEIVIKGENDAPWLPLRRHGQGVKSLSVIYLFNAFVARLLKETFTDYSEPIVAIEEPEVHLHPQAVRALWSQIDAMPGQKVIATHSPYFMQYVPIRDVRRLRRGADGVQVHFVPEAVSVDLPANDALATLADHADELSYDSRVGLLTAYKPLGEGLCRRLLRCYPAATYRQHHATIRELQERSKTLLEEEDVEVLEDWARRIRGEIFFSRFWILCEGQSEVFLLTALFDALGLRLDTQGVSLIDYQNNGSPRAFVCLARALGFPWALLTDGDQQGPKTLASLQRAGFSEREIDARLVQLADGKDLEGYVVGSAWRRHVLEIAKELDVGLADDVNDGTLASALRGHKPLWARRLGDRFRQTGLTSDDLPGAFRRLRAVLPEPETALGATSKR